MATEGGAHLTSLERFRYRDAKTDKTALRTLPSADFLWLVLQHVLPKGLRRSRNFGFLHPNSAGAIRLLQVLHLRAVRPTGASAMPPQAAWRCVSASAASPCACCAGACRLSSLSSQRRRGCPTGLVRPRRQAAHPMPHPVPHLLPCPQ